MKSFGVRLTAGLVTILFGAYAAALAQKDKQNDSESWTAQAPSLGEPAVPIAAGPIAARPITGVEDEAASTNGQSLAAFAGSAFGDPAVALVQHTEDLGPADLGPADLGPADLGPAEPMATEEPAGFDVSQLPASLGAPEPAPAMADAGAAMSTDVPDWSMSAPVGESDFASEPAATMPPPADVPPMEFTGDSLPTPEPFSEPSLSMTFPSEAPPAETSSAPQPNFAAEIPPMNLAAAPPMEFAVNPAAASQPSNDLRGMAMGSNELRTPPTQQDFAPQDFAQQDSSPQGANMSAQGYAQPQTFAPEPQVAPQQQYSAQQQYPAQQQFQANPSYPDPRDTRQPAPARTASLAASGQLPAAIEIDPSAIINTPGERRLEGVQSPSIVIQKMAPAEVKVGKPAEFKIHVQNVGAAEALDVRIHDRVPLGMRLVDASPAPVQQGNVLMWELGGMQAGQDRTVTMKLIPEEEGELGSVARVTFEAAASVRTISTRPELKIVQTAPEKVLIGQQLEIELEVSNPGSGDATGVSLQEDVPQGLDHPRGRQLDNLIGRLAAGEVRRQVLRLRAVEPGMIQNTIRLVSEDGLTAEHTIAVEVVAPQLAVELQGPSRRFLERQATYQLSIANTGTADATNLEIAVGLDRGFNFISTDSDSQGVYDPSKHAVLYSAVVLPAGQTANIPLTLLPVEAGERALTVDARADLGTVAKSERKVTVEGFAELSFSIVNPGGPIELGAVSNYEITVSNSGSMKDSNVRVGVQLPNGLELVSADDDNGQASANQQGQVSFTPRAELLPGQLAKYRFQVRGVAPGTHLVKAIVVSDTSAKPVTKEESTMVYTDQ